MASVRTFVAVELPEEVRKVLVGTVDRLKAKGVDMRWVRTEGLHITLKFLGDVEEDRILEVIATVGQVARGFAPFALQIAGLGGFPSRDRARVCWVGIEGEVGMLVRLQAGIEGALVALGYPREDRQFVPHLTLGRARRRPVALPDASAGRAEGARFSVERVLVMKSDLRSEGAVYTALGGGVLEGVPPSHFDVAP